jgi:hypothetical protein
MFEDSFETDQLRQKKEKYLEEVKDLIEITMAGNKRGLEKKHEGKNLGQIPRIYVRTEDIKRTFLELNGLSIENHDGKNYSLVFPEEKLSDLYKKYENFSTPLGKFIKEGGYQDSILVLNADCKDMKEGWNSNFLVELVENFPDVFLQEQSAEKNVFFVLVFDKKDWVYFQMAPRGLIRQPSEVCDDYLYRPEIVVLDEWGDEYKSKNKK